MVCGINAGLHQKIFSVRADDSRWPNADIRDGFLYDFDMPNNLPARAHVVDVGCGELGVRVAVNAKGDGVRRDRLSFSAGDAVASGYLERARGAWIQSEPTALRCRKYLVPVLASILVDPEGFGDRGKVIW